MMESATLVASSAVTGSRRGLVHACMLALSFYGGFQIMVLEVCGFRVLQTQLGSSVLVTGTLLTMIMVVLSAGYYLGGRLSERVRSVRILLFALLASVAYTHLCDVLYLKDLADLGYALRERLGRYPYLQAALPAAALSLVLYGPPVLAMSMTSPFLIRLEGERSGAEPGQTGRQSGFYMSLSTVGSIVGTLLASYALIPAWGVRTTVAATGAVQLLLLLVALLLTERRLRVTLPATSALAVLGLASVVYAARERPDADVVFERESFYGNIRVVREVDAADRPILAYRPSRVYTHSVLYPDEPLRELVGLLYLLPPLLEPPRNILVLGSAAGGVLRQTELLFPDARVVGVDLDPGVHDAAVQAFGVDPERSTLVADDARAYLATHDERFDFVVVDLFAGEFIPSHCITREFFALVASRLAPTGALFVNTNMNDVPFELGEDEPFRAFRHLTSTLREAGFPTLFENRYFHALYAYPRALELADFQERLARLGGDATKPAPVRAAAGLARYTTAPLLAYPRRYRPFSDAWAPELSIELKSNESALFERFARLRGDTAALHHDHPVARQTLAQLLREGAVDGDYGALRRSDPLLRALNELGEPLTPADRALAARYLHFGFDEAAEPLAARTAWAQLAAGYAQLYTHAYENDYEGVLGDVAALDRAFAAERVQ